MTADAETLAVYQAKAAEYAARFDNDSPGTSLKRFMDALPEGGAVLDLGCGTGASAALLQSRGFALTCHDASPAMIKAAREKGLSAYLKTFDDLEGEALYDGIWANFSLLHAAREDLPRHLAAISRALKPGGIFHIGMKIGSGTRRDALGRRYTFVAAEELRDLLTSVGITPTYEHRFVEAGLAGTEDEGIVMQGHKIG